MFLTNFTHHHYFIYFWMIKAYKPPEVCLSTILSRNRFLMVKTLKIHI